MKIILINGKKRSGKDHIANCLCKNLKDINKTCTILHFADALKEILAITFNITLEELDTYKNNETKLVFDEKSLDFRQLLQRFGTDAMQSIFGKNVWRNYIEEKIKTLKCDYVLIPDFRFKHEYIENSFSIYVKGGISNDSHISENELNDFKFDYIIDNTLKCNIDNEIIKLINLIEVV